MMLWLLDTHMVSDIIRHPKGRVRQKIKTVGLANTCTSIVVACELRFGAAKRQSASLAERIEDTLYAFNVQPLSENADRHYALLRCDLEAKGTPISGNDMLIAAHALALDCVLVTANTREFSRIEGLRVENWLD